MLYQLLNWQLCNTLYYSKPIAHLELPNKNATFVTFFRISQKSRWLRQTKYISNLICQGLSFWNRALGKMQFC